MSEYSLRLKATLDTREVQQKLNELRQLQNSSLGGNANSKSGSAVNQTTANIGSLPSVLNRLNSTLMQLQNSINRLNSISNAANSRNRSGLPSFIPIGDITRFSSSRRPVQTDTVSTINSTIRDFQQMRRDLGAHNGLGDSIRDLTRLRNNPSVRNWRTAMDYADNGFAWAENLEARFGRNGNRAFGRSIRGYSAGMAAAPYLAGAYDIYGFGGSRMRPTIADVNRPADPRLMRALRWGGGLAAHQIMGEAQAYFQASGNTTGSSLMGIGQTAAIGGAIGGPLGAGLGAVIGTLTESFKILTDRVRDLNSAIDNQTKRYENAKQIDEQLKTKQKQDIDQRRLTVGDTTYFNKELGRSQKRLDALKSVNSKIGLTPGSLSYFEKETQRMLEYFKAASPSGKVPEYILDRQRRADNYRTNLLEIDKENENIKSYKQSLEQLGVYDEDKSDLLQKQNDVKRMSNFQLKALTSITQDDLTEIQDRKKRLLKLSEQSGTPASLETLEQLQKEIDTYTSRLDILKNEKTARDDIKNELDRKSAIEELDTLQTRLQNLKTPRMDQVNSLASQGFNINKNDDEIRWKIQTDYQKEQTSLQREIRDRIKQMDTSSQFN